MLELFILLSHLLTARPSTAVQQEPFEITKRLTWVHTEEDMRRLCNAGAADIRGCTQFVGETLLPELKTDNGRWSMTIKGRVTAIIVVANPEVIDHELKHIRDIRASIGDFLATAQRAAYPSRESCAAAAEALVSGFPHKLKMIADASNAKLR